MPPLVRSGLALAAAALLAGWWLTRPNPIPAAALAGIEPDIARGEQVFWAAGCAACHAAPDASGSARLILSGGQEFPSDFGTFVAPNISPDAVNGIGAWSRVQFVNAVMRGVLPGGRHAYPALPYTAYGKADPADIVSLFAFLRSLPPSDAASRPHRVAFPFSIRRLIGAWKRLFADRGWWLDRADLTEEERRGRYLVEALGHCAECHTPRGMLGGLDRARWMAGAPIPGSARGRSPNLTPARLDWSKEDIANYLATGFTPDYDSAGGHMARVVENLAHLQRSDLLAIAAYVKRLPAAE